MFAPKVVKPQTKAAANSRNELAPQRSALATRPFGGRTVEQAHFLHGTIGNQATLRLLAQRTSKPARDHLDDAPAQEHDGSAALGPGLSWDFSKIPLFPPDRPNRPRASSAVAAPPLSGDMQPNLTVGEVNDPLEHEADHVADERAAPPAPPIVHEALRGPSAPLDASTRKRMESRLGHNFAHVRVHTDERAAASARAVGALAYTVGRSIVFDRGRYAPNEDKGRGLLAHELVHTLQQSGREPPSSDEELRVDSPTSPEEGEAQTIAATSTAPHRDYPSRASQLLSRSQSNVPFGKAILQRAVPTSGGDWDTDHYEAVKDLDASGNPIPAAQNVRGADITLKFKPNNDVNAELIGLTQSVQSYVGGALALTPAAATRAIPAADAKPINTGKGETDEGTAIDRASGYNNPIYPVKSVASVSLADPNTAASWGQLGWHYTDVANRPKHQDATLVDAPRRPGADKNSRQIFEVAALATKGAQAGTYYGSVRWGWRTDSAANLTKIDLQKVSDGVPSSTFIKAAGIWDKGAANVKLGAPGIMVTTGPVTLTPKAVVMLPIVLPVGTRLQIISGFHPPFLPGSGTVKVIDGPHTEVVGDIDVGPAPGPLMPPGPIAPPPIVPERP
jgi:hypothetical protein